MSKETSSYSILKNLAIEMVKTWIFQLDVVSIYCDSVSESTGTLAAPFTFGVSLIATGAGIGNLCGELHL